VEHERGKGTLKGKTEAAAEHKANCFRNWKLMKF